MVKGVTGGIADSLDAKVSSSIANADNTTATAIANANSKTDIGITVKSAEGTVEKMKTKTTGDGANVGVAMVNG